jgi:hypothetical protein
MSEMVDRVARAIRKEMKDIGYVGIGLISADQLCGALAETAIEAMRTPTDRMCNSGAAKWDDDWCTETNALNMWQGMVDEALK